MKLEPAGPAAKKSVAVVKIGGSILTSACAYRQAAKFVAGRFSARPNEYLVVVVSAEEGTTDSLERTALEITPEPRQGALDLLWSTGEIRSVALLALHCQALDVPAAPLNVHQNGLVAQEDDCCQSRVHVNARCVMSALTGCGIVIVPGFLACDPRGGIISLGRGASDLTAVLLAQGLDAARCELIKDVPGYFTADPHLDPTARHIPHLTFDEALAFADAGCDLVQRKAIVAAAQCGLPLVVRTIEEAASSTIISSANSRTSWNGPSDGASAISNPIEATC